MFSLFESLGRGFSENPLPVRHLRGQFCELSIPGCKRQMLNPLLYVRCRGSGCQLKVRWEINIVRVRVRVVKLVDDLRRYLGPAGYHRSCEERNSLSNSLVARSGCGSVGLSSARSVEPLSSRHTTDGLTLPQGTSARTP